MLPRPAVAHALLLWSVLLVGWPATPASAQTCTPLTAGAIAGIVFHDANGDGVRQAPEAGVNGVVLRVTGPTGSVLLVSSGGVGDIPGLYSTGVALCDAGEYVVELVSVPAGYVVSGPASRRVTLTFNTNGVLSKVSNLNFSLALAPCTSSIGDRVWEDRNANGIQDDGEPGLAGVTIDLHDGDAIATTATDANGFYTFVVPCSRTYGVRATTPSGFAPSPPVQGPDRAVDSDGSPVDVTVGAGEHRSDVDFGFYALCHGIVGDLVWHDVNRNGVQDAGEPGLYNVRLELVQDGEVRTAYTDAGGSYEFTGVCQGPFQVRVDPITVPSGFEPTLLDGGDDETDSNPSPSTVTLTAFDSQDLTIDFGFQVPCSGTIGDVVWNDTNGNGVQDAGESGIAGVQVRLYRQGESMPAQVTATSDSGFYQFGGVCGGAYLVEVDPGTLPAGESWVASPAHQGGDHTADSDGVDHRASVSIAAGGGSDLTVDFGYHRAPAQELWAGESATGFGTVYPKGGNWFMYTPYSTSVVRLVAGRHHWHAGDIYMSRTGSGSTARTIIRLVLNDGWRWAGVPQALKIHPFDRAPTGFVAPGAFLYGFTAPDVSQPSGATVVFSGNTATVSLPGDSPRFYGIHADVQRLVP